MPEVLTLSATFATVAVILWWNIKQLEGKVPSFGRKYYVKFIFGIGALYPGDTIYEIWKRTGSFSDAELRIISSTIHVMFVELFVGCNVAFVFFGLITGYLKTG